MGVVLATHDHSLVLQQILHPYSTNKNRLQKNASRMVSSPVYLDKYHAELSLFTAYSLIIFFERTEVRWFLTAAGLPVELDVGDLALAVDERVGMHAKALHVAIVGGHTHIVLQKGELQNHKHKIEFRTTLVIKLCTESRQPIS